jgi:hypothetical protein
MCCGSPLLGQYRGTYMICVPNVYRLLGALLGYGVRLRTRTCRVQYPVMALPCSPLIVGMLTTTTFASLWLHPYYAKYPPQAEDMGFHPWSSTCHKRRPTPRRRSPCIHIYLHHYQHFAPPTCLPEPSRSPSHGTPCSWCLRSLKMYISMRTIHVWTKILSVILRETGVWFPQPWPPNRHQQVATCLTLPRLIIQMITPPSHREVMSAVGRLHWRN